MGAAAERGQGMASVCVRACVRVQERVGIDEGGDNGAPGNTEVCKSEIRKTKS